MALGVTSSVQNVSSVFSPCQIATILDPSETEVRSAAQASPAEPVDPGVESSVVEQT